MCDSAHDRVSLPDLPSKYWSTLTHHGHIPPIKFNVEDEFERLSSIHIDTHDTAYFSDFTYNKTIISPSTRTCSSLLSEMLRPTTESRDTSPATTPVEGLSDHGSYSTHSTPPLQSSPPRQRAACFVTPAMHKRPVCSVTNKQQSDNTSPIKAARHISFGIVTTSDIKTELTTPQFVSDADPEKDYSGEATPTVKRSFQVSPVATCRQSVERKVSNQSCHSDNVSTDEGNTFFTRPRAIRFGNSTTPSVDSSRRSSFNEISHGAVTDESTRCRSLHAGTNNSPPGIARSGLATCKSTLEAVLKKEAIAKVIETVPEDDEEDDEEDREEDDFDHEDDEEQDEEEEDEDADDFDDGQSFLELGSDDDGYQEDIESDDDLLDDDVYPPVLAESGTPKMSLSGRNGLQAKDSQAVSPRLNYTQVHRTAAPSESDLPDTTDFAPGNMDEDQAACIAFDVAIKDRKARRQPAKPSDIDPTFPQSGSDNDSDIEALQESPELNKNIKNICRSPTLQRKTTDRQRWHSPPLAKMVDLCRAKSLPRRYLTGRKGLYEPKPPRAVTIKQSNEQRAQRRREKTELRHNLRRNKQVIDHNGHEKMKVHCLSRKKLVATENPCVIRPIMSI